LKRSRGRVSTQAGANAPPSRAGKGKWRAAGCELSADGDSLIFSLSLSLFLSLSLSLYDSDRKKKDRKKDKKEKKVSALFVLLL
jgi:hypothetical protein